jgi:hypothetical protein
MGRTRKGSGGPAGPDRGTGQQAGDRAATPAWASGYSSGDHPPYAYTADVVGLAVAHAAGGLLVLSVERGGEPFAAMTALPGGFVHWEHDATARQAALRELQEETQAGSPDYIEALDTYDAHGRDPRQFAGTEVEGVFRERGNRVVSRADLALFRAPRAVAPQAGEDAAHAAWLDVYALLPWEDIRSAGGRAARQGALDALRGGRTSRAWRLRVETAFGASLEEWNEERAGERFRLLLEAGLVEESTRDRWGRPTVPAPLTVESLAMAFDHRTMLADALGRLRGKIKYVPALLVALMPRRFRLLELRTAIEAVSGRPLYRPNFHRVFVARKHDAPLLRPLGVTVDEGPGRPAELYTWSGDLAHTRLDPSIRMPWRAPWRGQPY